MNIDLLFKDEKKLNEKYNFYKEKRQIRYIGKDEDLAMAHLKKTKHNLLFFNINEKNLDFGDWLIVILYYSLYHAVLALISYKGYISKNHTASLILLIKYYSNFKEDIKLMHELSIVKEDAYFYTMLKEERHKASYTTKSFFSKNKIKNYKTKVISFVNKVENILNL